MRITLITVVSILAIFLTGCTQETQNSFSRSLQNWTGTDGVLDVYAGDEFNFILVVKYPENLKRKDLRLDYNIKDSDEKVVMSKKVLTFNEKRFIFQNYYQI